VPATTVSPSRATEIPSELKFAASDAVSVACGVQVVPVRVKT